MKKRDTLRQFHLTFLSQNLIAFGVVIGLFISESDAYKHHDPFLHYFEQTLESKSNVRVPKIDPDVNMNISQLISSKGYVSEDHTVQTEDGYLLSVQRIPHGISNHGNRETKPVVFLQHGLLSSGADWVVNLPNESLGFILADTGFDVWIGNSRGSTYSTRHVKYPPSSDKFWEFSWDQMATYDIPAVINYILDKTGQKQLYYIGHSQGTLQAFALFSQNQEMADKVKLFIALGPVATIKYIESPIKYLSLLPDLLAYGIFGKKDFLPNGKFIKILGDTVCKEPATRWLCDDILFLFCGFDVHNLNQTRLPVYVGHSPAGTSVQNMVHFAQMSRSKKFQMYDYGCPEQNKLHYNQTTPPVYNVSNMKTPVALFWADKDWLADPQDVKELIPKLSTLVGSYEIKDWNHLDFIWGLDAASIIYKTVIKLLRS